jgi:hypothetical protein
MTSEICDTPTITDVIVQGVERVEILGDHARIVYWHWKFQGGKWVKTISDVAIVPPLSSFSVPIERWCKCVVRVPGPDGPPEMIGPDVRRH